MRNFLIKVICFGICISSTQMALAAETEITFDEFNVGSSTMPIPDNYYGFQWNNWSIIDGWDYVGGYENGVVSRNNVAYAPYGAPSSIVSTGLFDLTSAYMTAAWSDGLQLEVKG